jgi:hypothetical protein
VSRATRLIFAITAAAVLLMAGCSAGTAHPAASPAPLPPDPHTAAALLKIATAFNHDYDRGDDGPVYDRWDARRLSPQQYVVAVGCDH